MTLEEFVAAPPTEIVKYPDPVLTTRAAAVGNQPRELMAAVGKILTDAMYRAGGIGLAGPQLGLPYQVFVMDPYPYEPGGVTFLWDPEIRKLSTQTSAAWEGCLSLPGVRRKVVRPRRVNARFMTLEGEKKVGWDGLMARVFLHEFDHTQGILLFTRCGQDLPV